MGRLISLQIGRIYKMQSTIATCANHHNNKYYYFCMRLTFKQITDIYPRGSEIPQRPSDPIGIQAMHLSFQPPKWSPLSGSCDCLLSVPSPDQPRAGEEHLHLVDAVHLSAAKQGQTYPGQVRKTSTLSDRLNVVRDLCVCEMWNTICPYILHRVFSLLENI